MSAEAFEFSDALDGALHSFGQLGLEDDVALALAFEGGGGDGLSEFVAGAARVLAGIFRIHRRDLQNDETEIAESADAGTRLEGFAIEEPFDL